MAQCNRAAQWEQGNTWHGSPSQGREVNMMSKKAWRGALLLGAIAAALGVAVLGARSAQSRSAMSISSLLPGAWQAAPTMSAGWARAYVFRPDGRVQFHVAQSDCSSRVRGWSGRWKWIGPSTRFRLTIESEARWTGGKVQKSTGSCGTPTEIVGYKPQTVRLKHSRSFTMNLDGATYDERSGRRSIVINGTRYWRMGDAGDYR